MDARAAPRRIAPGAGECPGRGGGLEATNPQTGNVYNYNFTTKAWSEIGGPGEKFAVAADDHFVYGLSSAGLFIWNGALTWTQIGGPAADFAV